MSAGFFGLASKPKSTVSPGLASKLVATILVVWPQNHSLGFPGLGLKTDSCSLVIWPTKSPRWFLGLGLKTKCLGYGLWVGPQNPWQDENGVGHMPRSRGLLFLEASRARVS
jgi:hypothetical protein